MIAFVAGEIEVINDTSSYQRVDRSVRPFSDEQRCTATRISAEQTGAVLIAILKMTGEIPAIVNNGVCVFQDRDKFLAAELQLVLFTETNVFDFSACFEALMGKCHSDAPSEGAEPGTVFS